GNRDALRPGARGRRRRRAREFSTVGGERARDPDRARGQVDGDLQRVDGGGGAPAVGDHLRIARRREEDGGGDGAAGARADWEGGFAPPSASPEDDAANGSCPVPPGC